LVEQNIHEALTVCDRFVAIERGQIVMAWDAGDADARSRLIATLSV